MALIATAGETISFTPAPEGVHQAVCVDVIDKGMLPNKFKDGALQRKVEIAWQIEEMRDDGKRFVLYKRYTLSLNEKATLRHDLESWRGKKFTRDEEMGFDVESVIGANCLINVQHAPSSDGTKTFANVVSVMPLLKSMPKIPGVGYTRRVEENGTAAAEPEPLTPITDDDIPF